MGKIVNLKGGPANPMGEPVNPIGEPVNPMGELVEPMHEVAPESAFDTCVLKSDKRCRHAQAR